MAISTCSTVWSPSSKNRADAASSGPRRVLFVLLDEAERRTLNLALALATAREAELLVVKPAVLSPHLPLEAPDHVLDDHHAAVDRALNAAADVRFDVPVSGTVCVGRSLSAILATTVQRHGIDLLLLDAAHDGRFHSRYRGRIERLANALDCGMVATTGTDSLTDPASILVPVAGGPHSGLAIDIGGSLAVAYDVWIDLLNIIPPNASGATYDCAEEYLTTGIDRLDDRVRVDTRILEARDTAGAIVEETAYYDVTIIGAPRNGRLRRLAFGSTSIDIRSRTATPMLTTWDATRDRR